MEFYSGIGNDVYEIDLGLLAWLMGRVEMGGGVGVVFCFVLFDLLLVLVLLCLSNACCAVVGLNGIHTVY